MGYTSAWGRYLEAKFKNYAQRAIAINYQKRRSRVTHWENYGRKRNTFGAIERGIEQIWRAKASIWWLSLREQKTRTAKLYATYKFSFNQSYRRIPRQCWRNNDYWTLRLWRGRGQVSWVFTNYTAYLAQLRNFQCHEHAFRPIDGRAQGVNKASWGLS